MPWTQVVHASSFSSVLLERTFTTDVTILEVVRFPPVEVWRMVSSEVTQCFPPLEVLGKRKN